MARIVTRENAGELLDAAVKPELWTALIPAAGRGTRLNFDKPKILFPVGGVTILERLVQLLTPFCAELVFVLSPDGAPVVEPEIQRLLGARGRAAIQPAPLGMGDAVACGLPEVRTPFVTVIWGDQFGIKPASLDFGTLSRSGPGPTSRRLPYAPPPLPLHPLRTRSLGPGREGPATTRGRFPAARRRKRFRRLLLPRRTSARSP